MIEETLEPALQIIPDSKKLQNQKLPKEYKISIQLISETSLDHALTEKLTEDEKIQAVIQLKSIHLQWLNIKKIQNLQVFTNLNILYLQHNKISKIQHLECLKNLQYLALNDNLISKLENLSSLSKLQGLNLSNNQIEQLPNAAEFPRSLQLLSLKNNPVCLDTNYKVQIIKALPILDILDDHTVTAEERLKVLGKFPQHLIQYSEKMRQFREKQKAKKQQKEGEKPFYLGGLQDSDKGVAEIKQIRDKTDKYVKESKQVFEKQTQDQKQNFEQKVKISRKIRKFKQDNQKNKGTITEVDEEHDQN